MMGFQAWRGLLGNIFKAVLSSVVYNPAYLTSGQSLFLGVEWGQGEVEQVFCLAEKTGICICGYTIFF